MPFVDVGRHRRKADSKELIVGIKPHEYGALRGVDSPIQDQLNKINIKIDELFKSINEKLESEISFIVKSMNEELVIISDRIKAGETPIPHPEDALYAVVNKNCIVDKVIIWSESSSYTPDLTCFTVKVDGSIKPGMIYKNKIFFKNNIWTKIYFFFKGIK